MESLSDLGFTRNMIMETVVSTFGERNESNAAPMGAVTKDMQHLIIRPYVTSQTYRNLKAKKCAVVNLTSDPEVYYHTALKESKPPGKITSDWFVRAEVVDAPKLTIADAFIEVSVVDMKSLDTRRGEVLCNIQLIRMKNVTPRAYCRGTFACIEAIIHATRVEFYLNQGKVEEAQRLIGLIEHYRALVNRVAPHSSYSRLMSDLAHRVDSWRTEFESPR